MSHPRPKAALLRVFLIIAFVAGLPLGCVEGGGAEGKLDLVIASDGVHLGKDKVGVDQAGGDTPAGDSVVSELVQSDAGDKEAIGTDLPIDGVDGGAPEIGEFLYPCDENKECYSGYCVEAPEGGLCSKTCFDTSSCPPGWSCSQLSGVGDTAFICIPNDTYLCRPCESDDDCNTPGLPKTGVCRTFGDFGSICTRKCDGDITCPDGFSCEDIQPYGPDGPVVSLCDSQDGEACSCTQGFVDQQASTPCVVKNDLGTCDGEIVCMEVGPLPACNALPASSETCNGVDDDCDGVVDEIGAEGCTTYYLDTDGDGFGLGYGECHCEKPDTPGQIWLLQGGDCNELVATVNPAATEVCNGFDDNCDGLVDESGAVGCIPHFADEDADGYGNENIMACICAGNPFWTELAGDCEDHDPAISPVAIEICDKVDNDCDGVADEEGSEGCTPFFKDIDGDGYGVTQTGKCLCDPVADYTATKPNDCDESDVAINPSASEICNGVDDNCNQETDEGPISSLCPPVPNGETVCTGLGGCDLGSCNEGWSDADGDVLNGCECGAGNLELEGTPGSMCQDPHFLGTVIDTGEELAYSDNVVSSDPNGAPDEDWYSFQAIDGPDVGGCDSFYVEVKFEHNPGGQFIMDVYRGSCAGADNVCSGVSLYTEAVNFFDDAGAQPLGECPCAAVPNDDETSPGVQRCTDQTATYYVRVYRKPGFEVTCESYTLRASNGF